MLQPRIPIRQLPLRSLRLLPPSRNYASVMEAPTSSPPDLPLDVLNIDNEPPPLRDESMGGSTALRRYTPRTPGVRHLVRPVNDHLFKGRPLYGLTFPKKGQALGGRNNTGRITVRHHGGGHKRRIRIVDFHRSAMGEHLVERIEHDPGRSAHIALVTHKETGDKSYIVAAEGLRAGDTVQSYRSGIPKQLMDSMGGSIDQGVLASKTAWRGNCLPLGIIPLGTPIFNISITKEGKALYCRSAGTHGVIVGKGEDVVRRELIKRMDAKRARAKAEAVERVEMENAAQIAAAQEDEIEAERAATPAAEIPEETDKRGRVKKTKGKSLAKKQMEARLDLENAKNQDQDQNEDQDNANNEDEGDDQISLGDEDARKLQKAAQYVTVRLSSGEVRLIDKHAVATVGVASNANFQYRQLGKAGRSRWLGIRPTVRGVAMNACDHPHGGGRGKGKGNRDPVSPWGVPTKSGYKTRSKHKVDKLVVQPRPRNQGKRRRGYN